MCCARIFRAGAVVFFSVALITGAGAVSPWEYRLSAAGTLDGVTSGRFEARPSANADWGVACDDGFDANDADVACRSVGFPSAASFRTATANERGSFTQAVHLDELECTGAESRLDACSYVGVGQGDCFANEAVVLTCQPGLVYQLAPAGELNGTTQGRLEARASPADPWGLICASPSAAGASEAAVACKTLGLGPPLNFRMVAGDEQGPGAQPTVFAGIDCVGNETDLQSCGKWADGATCSPSSAIVLRCAPTTWEYRLASPSSVGSTGGPHGPESNAGGSSPNSTTTTTNTPTAAASPLARLEARAAAAAPWATVCDDGFDANDAAVACRSLGLPTAFPSFEAAGATSLAGSATQSIAMDDLNCRGGESSLDKCSYAGAGAHNCEHAEDVTLSCSATAPPPSSAPPVGPPSPTSPVDHEPRPPQQPAPRGEFRIEPNPHAAPGVTQGRLEVRFNASLPFGVVCDDGFGALEALVACRSLGVDNVTRAEFRTVGAELLSREQQQQVAMDDVVCTGSELSLSSCTYTPATATDCEAGEAVEVTCATSAAESSGTAGHSLIAPEPWQYRLVSDDEPTTQNAAVTSWGILELRAPSSSSAWRRVCAAEFTSFDARVACRSLGSGSALVTPTIASVVVETGPEPLNSRFVCEGSESRLDRCSNVSDTSLAATCSAVVHLTCTTSSWQYRLMAVRGPIDEYGGRLETGSGVSPTWSVICADGFGKTELKVACKTMGYGYDAELSAYRAVGPTGVALGALSVTAFSGVKCTGSESRLDHCARSARPKCEAVNAVYISCQEPAEPWPVRLVDGSRTHGRLEAREHDKPVFGTVCADGFGAKAAKVACRALGFVADRVVATAERALRTSAGVGRDSQPVFVTGRLACTGFETQLDQCDVTPVSRCADHAQDVAVTCRPLRASLDWEYRVVGGDGVVHNTAANGSVSGRLEVKQRRMNATHSSEWGSVCGDLFDARAAEVACRTMLPLNTSVIASFRTVTANERILTPRTTPISMDDVVCTGTEAALDECQFAAVSDCVHDEDVAVTCTIPTAPTSLRGTSEYRLEAIAGDHATYAGRGRLEVRLAGSTSWGCVPLEGFTLVDAAVACTTLNIASPTPAIFGVPPRQGQLIGMSHAACIAGTASLDECPQIQPSAAVCPAATVGLDCGASAFEYRLSAGPTAGTLQFRTQQSEAWSSVCHRGMTQGAATAACRTIAGDNFTTATFMASPTGDVVVPPTMENVTCGGGTNDKLTNGACHFRRPTSTSCIAVHLTCNATLTDFSRSVQMRIDNVTGLVEVRPGSTAPWGTICSRGMTAVTAGSLCAAAGNFPATIADGPTAAWRTLTDAPVTGPVYFSEYSCAAGARPETCERTVLSSDCGNDESLALDCQAAADQYRLVRANAAASGSGAGRLQMRTSSSPVWNHVCGASEFRPAAAAVACASVGFAVGTTGIKVPSSVVPMTNLTAAPLGLLDTFACAGDEASLSLCPRVATTSKPVVGGGCAPEDQVVVACGASVTDAGCEGASGCANWVAVASNAKPPCDRSRRLVPMTGSLVSDADCRALAVEGLPVNGTASYVMADDRVWCDLFNCSFNVGSLTSTIGSEASTMYAGVGTTAAGLGLCSPALSCSGRGIPQSSVVTGGGTKALQCVCKCDEGYFGASCNFQSTMATVFDVVDVVYTHPSAGLTFGQQSSAAERVSALFDSPTLSATVEESARLESLYVERVSVASSDGDAVAAIVGVRELTSSDTAPMVRRIFSDVKPDIEILDIAVPSVASLTKSVHSSIVGLASANTSAISVTAAELFASRSPSDPPVRVRTVTITVTGARRNGPPSEAKVYSNGVFLAECDVSFADDLSGCASAGSCDAELPFLNATGLTLSIDVANIAGSCFDASGLPSSRRQTSATAVSYVEVEVTATGHSPLADVSLASGAPVAAALYTTAARTELIGVVVVIVVLSLGGVGGTVFFGINRQVVPAVLLAAVVAVAAFFYTSTALSSIADLGTGSTPSAFLFVDEYRSSRCDGSNLSSVPHRISLVPADGICHQLTSYGTSEREYWIGSWCGRNDGEDGYDPWHLVAWFGQTQAQCDAQTTNRSIFKAARCYDESGFFLDKAPSELEHFKVFCTSGAMKANRTDMIESALDPQRAPDQPISPMPVADTDRTFGATENDSESTFSSRLRFFVGAWRSSAARFIFSAQSDAVQSVALATFSVNDVTSGNVGMGMTDVLYDESETPPALSTEDGTGVNESAVLSEMATLGPLFNSATREAAFGANAMRYEGIRGTDLDIGALEPERGFTITFWVDADSNTRGFVFLVTDAWLRADGSTPIADQLRTVLGNPGRRFFVDDWGAYAGIYIDGGTKTLRFLYRHPDGFLGGASEDLRWNDPDVTGPLFDGGWHFVALIFTLDLGRGKVQIAVDGRTSFTNFNYLECMSLDARFHPVRHLPDTVHVFQNATERVTQDGVAYVGYLNAGVFGFMVHRRALDYQVMLALGSGKMEEAADIDVATTQLTAWLLLTLVMLLSLGTFIDAALVAKRKRDERHAQAAISSNESHAAASTAPLTPSAVVAHPDDDDERPAHGAAAGNAEKELAANKQSQAESGRRENFGSAAHGKVGNPKNVSASAKQAGQEQGAASNSASGGISSPGSNLGVAPPSALEQLAVIVPIFLSVAQNMSMYIDSFQWPEVYLDFVAWAFIPFNFSFLSLPSLPVWVSYAAQFSIAVLSIVAVLVLSRGDRKRFRARVLEPAETDGIPLDDGDILAGLKPPLTDDPACHVSALRCHLGGEEGSPDFTVLGNFSRVALQNAITKEIVADAARCPAEDSAVECATDGSAVLKPDASSAFYELEPTEARSLRCFAVLTSPNLNGEEKLLGRERSAAKGLLDIDGAGAAGAATDEGESVVGKIATLPVGPEEKLSLCGLPGAMTAPATSKPLLSVYAALVAAEKFNKAGSPMQVLQARPSSRAGLERLVHEVSIHLPVIAALKSAAVDILADTITVRRTRALARARARLSARELTVEERQAVHGRIASLRSEDFVQRFFSVLPDGDATACAASENGKELTAYTSGINLQHLRHVRSCCSSDVAASTATRVRQLRRAVDDDADDDDDGTRSDGSDHSSVAAAPADDVEPSDGMLSKMERLTEQDLRDALRAGIPASAAGDGAGHGWLASFERLAAAGGEPRSLLRAAVGAGVPCGTPDQHRFVRDCAVVTACLHAADADSPDRFPETLYATQALCALLQPVVQCSTTGPASRPELTDPVELHWWSSTYLSEEDHEFVAQRCFDRLTAVIRTFEAPIAALHGELPKATLKFGYVTVERQPLAARFAEHAEQRRKNQVQLDKVHEEHMQAAEAAASRFATAAGSVRRHGGEAEGADDEELGRPNNGSADFKPIVGPTTAPDFHVAAKFHEVDLGKLLADVKADSVLRRLASSVSHSLSAVNQPSLGSSGSFGESGGGSHVSGRFVSAQSVTSVVSLEGGPPPILLEAVRNATPVPLYPVSKQTLCPTHGERLLPAVDAEHMILHAADPLRYYPCAHRNNVVFQNLCCTPAQAAGRCDVEFFVCPHDGCNVAVCSTCLRIGAKDKNIARLMRLKHNLFKAGSIVVVGLIIIVIAQSMYQPAIKSAVSAVFCHVSLLCHFPTCYAPATPAFLAVSVCSAFMIVTLGVGLVWFFFHSLVGRKIDILESSAVDGRLVRRGGWLGRLLWCSSKRGSDVPYTYDGAVGVRDILTVGMDDRTFRALLRHDTSMFKGLYEQYELQWMIVHPVTFVFKVGTLLAVLYAGEPNELRLIVAVAAVEVAQLFFYVITAPFVDAMLDFLAKSSSLHQVAQLGLVCLHRANTYENPNDNRAITAMIVLSFAYLLIVVGVVVRVAVYPVAAAFFNRRKRVKKDRERLRGQRALGMGPDGKRAEADETVVVHQAIVDVGPAVRSRRDATEPLFAAILANPCRTWSSEPDRRAPVVQPDVAPTADPLPQPSNDDGGGDRATTVDTIHVASAARRASVDPALDDDTASDAVESVAGEAHV